MSTVLLGANQKKIFEEINGQTKRAKLLNSFVAIPNGKTKFTVVIVHTCPPHFDGTMGERVLLAPVDEERF